MLKKYEEIKYLQNEILNSWNNEVKPFLTFITFRTSRDAETKEEALRIWDEIFNHNQSELGKTYRNNYDIAMNRACDLYKYYENVVGPDYQLFITLSIFLPPFIENDRKIEAVYEQANRWYKINIEERTEDSKFIPCVDIAAIKL